MSGSVMTEKFDKDFWEDEELWSRESWAGPSLKEEWEYATDAIAEYIEIEELHGKHVPGTLASNWMKCALEAAHITHPDYDSEYLINTVTAAICEDNNIGRTMNMFDLLRIKQCVPSGYLH
jgi:hypothetical protein